MISDKIIGIYKITSPTGKVYIGQSIDCFKRKKAYKNGHCKAQIKLYNSFTKYGWVEHNFEIIHQCGREELNELEKYYIEHYNSLDNNLGLNIQQGGICGIQSEETKKKISESNKGKKMSDSAKEKMSLARKGWHNPNKGKNGYMSDETIKKMRIAKIGTKRSPESVEKYKQKMIGRKQSVELVNKRAKFHKGRKRSIETRLKISLAKKGKVAWNKGIPLSQETKDKMKRANIDRTKFEKAKISEKLSKAAKKRYENGTNPLVGRACTEEIKHKISRANKGNKSWLGKKHSIESRMKMSLSQKKRKRKRQSKETIDKRVESMKWYKHSDDTKNKIRQKKLDYYKSKSKSNDFLLQTV